MAIKLVCEPGKVVTWDEFKQYPEFSIAIDGYCHGRPRGSASGLRLNINHHEEVDRTATRSSCEQALVLVKMGLYRRYQVNGEPTATLYVNDCDQDVVLATYVLKYPRKADRQKLKHLIRLEDLLDMSAGLYPVSNPRKSHLMKQLAWATAPYTDARLAGSLSRLSGGEMLRLIEEMHRRLDRALRGRVPEPQFDTSFESQERKGWFLVRETGAQSRLGMVNAGVEAFVSVLEEHGGRWRYALGRLSQFIPFPIPHICAALNAAEGIGPKNPDRWSGSENCGGSPRRRQSRLSPAKVARIIDQTLERVRRQVAAKRR